MSENQALIEQASIEINKPTAKTFFKQQAQNEKHNTLKGLGSAPDFEIVFNKTLFDFLHIVRQETDLIPKSNEPLSKDQQTENVTNIRRKLRQRTQDFMEDMRSIEMEDTIYPDVKPSLPDLVSNVDNVLVWTSGHANYQLAKIEKSKIQNLLKTSAPDSKNNTVHEPLISRNKEKDTQTLLNQFSKDFPDGEITIVIYDDSQGNFEKSDKTIAKFENNTGRRVNRLFVWAKTGRVGENLTQEKEQEAISKLPANVQEHLRTISSFADFVEIVKLYRSQNAGPILALLDFDGAISDNRIMRLRQSQVFHNHLRKIIQDLVLPQGTKDQIKEIESQLSDLLEKPE